MPCATVAVTRHRFRTQPATAPRSGDARASTKAGVGPSCASDVLLANSVHHADRGADEAIESPTRSRQCTAKWVEAIVRDCRATARTSGALNGTTPFGCHSKGWAN